MSPAVRPYFLCEICGEIHPRTSNVQKYCGACRVLATSKKVAAYYQKNRREILKRRAVYRERNREQINEAQRRYYQETKGQIDG